MLADPTTLTRPPSHGGGPTLSDPANQTQPLPVGRSDHQQQVDPAELRKGLALSHQRRDLPCAEERTWTLLANTEARSHLYRNQQATLIARKEINLKASNSHVALNNHPACGAKAFTRQGFRSSPPTLLCRLHENSIRVRA